MRPRRVFAAALALLALGCTSKATIVVAPRLPGEAKITDEEVELRCAGEGAELRCDVHADYALRLPPESSSEALVVTRNAEQLRLRQGDEPAEAIELSAEDEDGPEALEQARESSDFDGDLGLSLGLLLGSRAQLFALDGSKPERLTLDARLVPEPIPRLGLLTVPALARHRGLAELLALEPCRYDRRGCRYRLVYVHAARTNRGPAHRARFTFHEPRGWTHERDEDERATALTLYSGREPVAPGGPLLGLGVGFEGADRVARLRLGWEFFAPAYVGHALALELDGRRRASLALTSELMSPQFVIFPSLGLGAGPLIQLAPRPSAGVRLQASAQLPFVGVLATLDWFPAQAELRPAIYAQLAF